MAVPLPIIDMRALAAAERVYDIALSSPRGQSTQTVAKIQTLLVEMIDTERPTGFEKHGYPAEPLMFDAAFKREIGVLFKVAWLPVDLPLSEPAIVSYVVAENMEDARLAFAANEFDIRSIERVHNGGVFLTDKVLEREDA